MAKSISANFISNDASPSVFVDPPQDTALAVFHPPGGWPPFLLLETF